jgi:hypothetical protein
MMKEKIKICGLMLALFCMLQNANAQEIKFADRKKPIHAFELNAPIFLVYNGPSAGFMYSISKNLNANISVGVCAGVNYGFFGNAYFIPLLLDFKGVLKDGKYLAPYFRTRFGIDARQLNYYATGNFGVEFFRNSRRNWYLQAGFAQTKDDYGADFSMGYQIKF